MDGFDGDEFASISMRIINDTKSKQKEEPPKADSSAKAAGGREVRSTRGSAGAGAAPARASDDDDVVNIDDDDGFDVKPKKDKDSKGRKRKRDDDVFAVEDVDEVVVGRTSSSLLGVGGGAGAHAVSGKRAKQDDGWDDLLRESEAPAPAPSSNRATSTAALARSCNSTVRGIAAATAETGREVKEAMARADRVISGDIAAANEAQKRLAEKPAPKHGAGKAKTGEDAGGAGEEGKDRGVKIGIKLKYPEKGNSSKMAELAVGIHMKQKFKGVFKRFGEVAGYTPEEVAGMKFKHEGNILTADDTPEGADFDLEYAEEERGTKVFYVDVLPKS